MADKITIFKEVFDYYYDGEITKEQLADLLLMHYETRWGNGVDVKEIEDKDLRKIWRILQYSVIKSTKNAKQYEKQQNKKTTLQDTLGTEFDQPEVEVKNKAILTPQTIQDNTLYTPRVESPSNLPQTPNKDDLAEFEKVIKEYKFNINDIVRDLRTNTESSIKQANIRLKELLNHYDIIPYREKVTKFIEDMTCTEVAS